MSENNFAKTDTVNQNNLASFNVKNIIFIILFCLYLSLNYVKLWNSIIRDFLIYIRNMQITIGNLQLYTLYALGLIYDCLLIALVVGILKYFFRKLSLLYSIMIGTILYFLNPIIYFFISLFFSLGNNS